MRAATPFPVLAALLLVLAACAPVPPADVPQRLSPAALPMPPTQGFGVPNPFPPARTNAEIAHDFIEYAFYMESGRELPVLSRFEGPVTVSMTGSVPAGAEAELARLVTRLRNEAGLDITRLPRDQPAAVIVEFMPRRQLQSLVPQAACFIVPRVSSWDEFRRNRRTPLTDWTTVVVREQAAVFIPSDTTQQEIRDCLHEEVAQAMGPLNDLYRVPESVFNDDNFVGALSGYDMLLLRAFNAPELRSGMTRAQVAARLPALLARLNPDGERTFAGPLPPRSPRAWVEAIETATGPSATRAQRRAAAERALRIATEQNWSDARLAFSLFTRARFARPDEGDLALASMLRARALYGRLPGAQLHAAHVDMHLAAHALSMGQHEQAMQIANRALPAATRGENAALMATLMMVKAEALDRLGRPGEARSVRLDSLGWARYGFGSEEAARARLEEIAGLARDRQEGSGT